MEKSQGQSSLGLIHLPSLKELIDLVRNTLTNTLHLLGTLRQFLTTRHFIVEVVNDFSGVLVRTNLEGIFEVFSIILEGLRNFLVGGSTLLKHLKLLHLPSREELIDDIGDALSDTCNLLGTLREFFATGHLEWKAVDDLSGVIICLTLVLILFVVSELIEHISKFTVVGDEKVRLRLVVVLVVGLVVGLVVRLFKNLTLGGCDGFGVVKVLIQELVNLGGDTLPNTLNLEETLTILYLKVESSDGVSSRVVRRSLVKVGGHLPKFLQVLGDVLIQLRSEGHTSGLQSHSDISYAVFCL